jgi:hypothetical protein
VVPCGARQPRDCYQAKAALALSGARSAALYELGRVAAEMNQVAREWARVTEDAAGPEFAAPVGVRASL